MGIPRRAKRRDSNEAVIIDQLRSIYGATVMIGDEVDLIIGYKGVNYLFEIKDPDKTLKQDGSWKSGALKPSQIKLQNEWKGHYKVVYCIEQILEELD